MVRRLAVVLAALGLITPACGDDDAPGGVDGAATTSLEEATDDADDAGAGTEATTTTAATVPDAAAEDPPSGTGGVEEGMGDEFVYVADLAGGEEVPGPGDPGGTGRIEIRPGDGELCIDMVTSGLASEVTDAHVHEGAAGASGAPVVPIGQPTSTGDGTEIWSDVCVDVDEQLSRRLATDASQFYANVHTAEHPDGAVRGQLGFATIFDLELS